MSESVHFHRGYSLRLHKSKPFINYGIIRYQCCLYDETGAEHYLFITTLLIDGSLMLERSKLQGHGPA
jgi:hypothetical protein